MNMALRIERPGVNAASMELWERMNGNRGECGRCGHHAREHWIITDTLDQGAERAECRECQQICAGNPGD